MEMTYVNRLSKIAMHSKKYKNMTFFSSQLIPEFDFLLLLGIVKHLSTGILGTKSHDLLFIVLYISSFNMVFMFSFVGKYKCLQEREISTENW